MRPAAGRDSRVGWRKMASENKVVEGNACREVEMTGRTLAGAVALAAGVMCNATVGISQSPPPKEGPAAGGSPAWFLQPSFPDPTGRTVVDAQGNVTIPPRGSSGGGAGSAAPPAPGVT